MIWRKGSHIWSWVSSGRLFGYDSGILNWLDWILFFFWFQIGLFSQIDLIRVPGLVRLLKDGESLADLQKLSPEQILVRWVNYHLENAGVERRLHNFTTDIQDSEIYTYLLKQIAPAERSVTLDPLNIQVRSDSEPKLLRFFTLPAFQGNPRGRAEAMLREADKLEARAFVTADDVANGVYKLNLAFVANLFNTWPGLKPPGEDEELGKRSLQLFLVFHFCKLICMHNLQTPSCQRIF